MTWRLVAGPIVAARRDWGDSRFGADGGKKAGVSADTLLDDLRQHERVVLVGTPDGLTERLRQRYPTYDIVRRETYLSGIAELGEGSVAAVLVEIEPTEERGPQIVSGFRTALPHDVPLVLCCEPAGEPAVREALTSGADDYLILPPSDAELDEGLRLARPGAPVPPCAAEMAGPAVPLEELAQLAETFRQVGQPLRLLLRSVAEFLQRAMRAEGVTLLYQGMRVSAGEDAGDGVLRDTLRSTEGESGVVLVGPRRHAPYGKADADKLRTYAELAGRLIETNRERARWQEMAMTDEVSGLPNRRYLLEMLERLIARAERERFCITVLLFDVDDFKRYNDTCGHEAGDEIIREIGVLFRRCSRQHDVVVRYGGDEFVVLFWDHDEPRQAGSRHPQDVLNVLERFKAALGTHEMKHLGREACGELTISGGLATYPWDGRTGEELLRQADRALLEAKRQGKNRIHIVGSPVEGGAGHEGPGPEGGCPNP